MVDAAIPEIWKPIIDYPGYEASSTGRIRSVDRTVITIRGPWRYRGKILRQTFNRRLGRFAISFGDQTTTMYVHQLVCAAFHGPRPSPSHDVAHYDGNCQNNRPDNLRWATRKENCADTARHGRTHRPQGEVHPRAKLTEGDVRNIRRLRQAGETQVYLARAFAISRWQLRKIISGESWGHID